LAVEELPNLADNSQRCAPLPELWTSGQFALPLEPAR
jgi:hypothetical protein